MAKLSVKTFADLEAARSRFLAEVDAAAEAQRRRYITASPGQTLTYEAKHREAERYPQGSRFPFLEAEAGALGLTVQAVADSVLAARVQWETVGARIEAERLQAKAAIRAAATAAEMHAIAASTFPP